MQELNFAFKRKLIPRRISPVIALINYHSRNNCCVCLPHCLTLYYFDFNSVQIYQKYYIKATLVVKNIQHTQTFELIENVHNVRLYIVKLQEIKSSEFKIITIQILDLKV